jgi:hypothetical protein
VGEVIGKNVSKFNKRVNEFFDLQEMVREVEVSPEDQIKIRAASDKVNIVTSRKILTSVPDSKLARLFSGDVALSSEKEEGVFLDTDVEVMKWMVSYLKWGRRELPRRVDTDDGRMLV